MSKSNHAIIKQYARTLRNQMTKEERHLWYDFLKPYPVRFLRQYIVDRYIVDFYCPSAKLVIEVDGSQHYESEGLVYDKIRTETLNQYGLTVLRFTNRQVNREVENVCLCIDLFLKGELTEQDLM